VAVAPRLRDLGWNVRVICIREEGPLGAELKAAGIPIDVIPFRSRLSPPALRQLSQYFRLHRAQVVHAHMYRSNIPATVAARLARVPAIFGQVHNVDSWDSGRQRFVDRLAARWRTGTIAVSRAVQEDVMRVLGQPRERVPILYNGIDVEKFQPDPAAGQLRREELGLAAGDVLFLVPARLHPQKNPLGVIEAAERALSASGASPFSIAFAGTGKVEQQARARAAASPYAARFLFLGERHDMPALYNASDAIVLSSFKEGFSNAVIEALACGKPVIASDVGGNREAISGPRFGWVHPPGDGAALAQQLGQAATRGRGGLAAMAADCRSRANDFSIEALVRHTHDLYCAALGRTPGRS
jgi:glycosyltransferase involved in cell wall biosynthesis